MGAPDWEYISSVLLPLKFGNGFSYITQVLQCFLFKYTHPFLLSCFVIMLVKCLPLLPIEVKTTCLYFLFLSHVYTNLVWISYFVRWECKFFFLKKQVYPKAVLTILSSSSFHFISSHFISSHLKYYLCHNTYSYKCSWVYFLCSVLFYCCIKIDLFSVNISQIL